MKQTRPPGSHGVILMEAQAKKNISDPSDNQSYQASASTLRPWAGPLSGGPLYGPLLQLQYTMHSVFARHQTPTFHSGNRASPTCCRASPEALALVQVNSSPDQRRLRLLECPIQLAMVKLS